MREPSFFLKYHPVNIRQKNHFNMTPQIESTMPVEKAENIEQSITSDDNNDTDFNVRKYLLYLLFIQWVSVIGIVFFKEFFLKKKEQFLYVDCICSNTLCWYLFNIHWKYSRYFKWI